jgi:hypothetical protein
MLDARVATGYILIELLRTVMIMKGNKELVRPGSTRVPFGNAVDLRIVRVMGAFNCLAQPST